MRQRVPFQSSLPPQTTNLLWLLNYVLYEQIEYIRGNVLSMLTAVFAGSIVGIVGVVLIAKAMDVDKILTASLAPRSVTTPIAVNLAETSGGIPTLAAAFVVICGIFGGLVGPIILRKIGIQRKIANGLAMGSASHALETVKAMEMGVIEGAICGLAIEVMDVMTALLIPEAKMLMWFYKNTLQIIIVNPKLTIPKSKLFFYLCTQT